MSTTTTTTTDTDTCTCGCGRPPGVGRSGKAEACYQRWRKANYPVSGPPAPKCKGNPEVLVDWLQERTALKAEMVEEFAMLRATRTRPDGSPITIAEAAAILGVSARTGDRYAAVLRKRKEDR